MLPVRWDILTLEHVQLRAVRLGSLPGGVFPRNHLSFLLLSPPSHHTLLTPAFLAAGTSVCSALHSSISGHSQLRQEGGLGGSSLPLPYCLLACPLSPGWHSLGMNLIGLPLSTDPWDQHMVPLPSATLGRLGDGGSYWVLSVCQALF